MVGLKNRGFNWTGVGQKCKLLQNCHSWSIGKQMGIAGRGGSSWDSDDDTRIVGSIINLAYPGMDRLG